MGKSKIYFILALMVFVIAGCLQTAGDLKGKVTDSAGAAAGAGVYVYITENNYAAATDSQGNYRINGVALGSYTVRAVSGTWTGSAAVTLSDPPTGCTAPETQADIQLN